MLQFFLNPWLLLGLAGIALPVIAHLLSRRRFDVVEWAAMQFLNPARKTRRRLKLEELLLLSLRIGMVVLLAVAASRPWLPSGLLSGYRSSGSRSVVLVIDGSNTMARSDGLNTLHQRAIRRALEFLDTLGPGDSVALIDARDQPRTVIESPLQDLRSVKEALQQLPEPAGAGNLQSAAERAIAILGRTSSTSREVVVLTDRQRTGWQPDNDAVWQRFEDLLSFPSVRPRLWALDAGDSLLAVQQNIAVGRLQPARDLTVPDFPLRLNSVIRNASMNPVQVPVRLLLDGQPLAGQQQNIDVPGRGEATLEFELLIRPTGTHVVTVEALVQDDPIPVDNLSHAAVHVTSALPVLLINGTPSINPVDHETFFAALALTTSENRTPWVDATVVDAANVRIEDLRAAAVVVLADVAALPDAIAAELVQFAAQGHGVVICCGPNTTSQRFDEWVSRTGLMPGVQLQRIRTAAADAAEATRIAPLSLQPGWLDRFRSDPARSFLKATYQQWWLTRLSAPVAAGEPTDAEVQSRMPMVLAQLTTGDPLLIQAACGDGTVLLLTSTLSRLWNDLPTRSDYVPFLHEAIFQAAASGIHRNVDSGTPLLAPVPQTQPVTQPFSFRNPALQQQPPSSMTQGERPLAVLDDTFLPGIYDLLMDGPAADAKAVGDTKPQAAEGSVRLDRFVVNYDHSEDDMTELTADDRARLIVNDRLRFADSLDDLQQRMYGSESRTELWAGLLFLFPGLLMTELLLTRRMIQRGYSGRNSEPGP